MLEEGRITAAQASKAIACWLATSGMQTFASTDGELHGPRLSRTHPSSEFVAAVDFYPKAMQMIIAIRRARRVSIEMRQAITLPPYAVELNNVELDGKRGPYYRTC